MLVLWIFSSNKKNSAAYLQFWLQKLKKDDTYFSWIASHGQRAFEWILGVKSQVIKGEPASLDGDVEESWEQNISDEWD